jgi:hypothetical protein
LIMFPIGMFETRTWSQECIGDLIDFQYANLQL